MFLPKLDLKTGSRAIIFFTMPEWNFAKTFLNFKNSYTFLNINLKYDEKSLIAGPIIGAPLLSIFLEILKNLGIKEIIAMGWAGKFKSSSLKIGDLFLPIKAYSLEGTSKFYFTNKKVFLPDKEITEKLKKELKNIELCFKKGSIISVDAPVRFEKNRDLIQKWDQKVEAMDMETSALFSIGSSLQIKICVLHFIIDEIGKFLNLRSEKMIKEKREKLLKIWRRFLNYEF
ncbi:hypothetical protein [Thermodesulfobacterium hydrogeniphilum]|uniref:phosphorylase family protein n=1 Tax=Thermodesulfobacterium hydrogeniphilum TaxID=161156 RepID=UPI000571EB37|nr:hypothetical protein [Thermodesulfobacterium hydrogeniphilum]